MVQNINPQAPFQVVQQLEWPQIVPKIVRMEVFFCGKPYMNFSCLVLKKTLWGKKKWDQIRMNSGWVRVARGGSGLKPLRLPRAPISVQKTYWVKLEHTVLQYRRKRCMNNSFSKRFRKFIWSPGCDERGGLGDSVYLRSTELIFARGGPALNWRAFQNMC